MRTTLAALVFLSVAPSASGSVPPDERGAECPAEVDRTQLALAYDQFAEKSWRPLQARGCADAAVALLTAYDTANQAKLTGEQIREIHFHAGQTLALARRDAESLPHFEAARGGDEEWAAYVDATLAFLKRDVAELRRQRERYAMSPKSSAMRLTFIDGFLACPNKTYMEAAHCALPH
jgi:hypothetical protein